MRFSICVPNFNYGRYLGETVGSVLAQDEPDFEVVVSDNASTDNSVEVVRGFKDKRVRISVNRWNVGFAGNLDKAAGQAKGDFIITLSSDDVMEPGALAAYSRLIEALGEDARRTVFGSTAHVVDSDGARFDRHAIDWKQWRGAVKDERLSRAVGHDVYRLTAHALLARSLELLRSPFEFLTTCFPRELYEAVEGYGGQRLINPDKWFNWKALSAAEHACVIDAPLFSYRVHNANQGSIQARSGALKHLVDQYAATFDLPAPVLAAGGVSADQLAAAFVEQDIALRGLQALADGDTNRARRGVLFGLATYPAVTRRNAKVWALRALLLLGPLGQWIARAAARRVRGAWAAREAGQAS